MAKDRVIVCENYLNEHNCTFGRDCRFWREMQICKDYKAKVGAKPARVNNKKQKLENMATPIE